MSDYLMREMAPFDAHVWHEIDEMVVRSAKGTLVGRKFAELVGPLGWGVEQAPVFGFNVGEVASAKDAAYLKLEELSSECLIKAKQLAIAAQTPFKLDLGAVALATIKLAQAEDKLIIGGLAKAAKTEAVLGDWAVAGGAFKAVAGAAAALLQKGFTSPYALVLGPALYAQLAGLVWNGERELELVKELVTGGIFQYTGEALAKQALVLSMAPWNFDMVVGQDIVAGYVGNEGLDQKLKIFETVALRVKLPGAICLLK